MDEFQQLYANIMDEWDRQADIFSDAFDKLREINAILDYERIFTALESSCGDGGTYRYPTAEQIGVHFADFPAGEQISLEFDGHIDAAAESGRREGAHVAFLMKSLRTDPIELAKLRREAALLADVLVEARLKIAQIDDILLILMGMDVDSTDGIGEFVAAVCALGADPARARVRPAIDGLLPGPPEVPPHLAHRFKRRPAADQPRTAT